MKLTEHFRSATRVVGAFRPGDYAVYDLTRRATDSGEPGQFIAGFSDLDEAIAYAESGSVLPNREWLVATGRRKPEPRYVVRDKYQGDDDLPSKVDYKVSTLRWYIVDTETGYLHPQDFAEKSEAEAVAAKLNG